MNKPISDRCAKRLIYSLISASHDAFLASHQDGGISVDVALSHNNPNKVMTIEESEKLMDKAIREAYRVLTGKSIKGDPFELISGDL